MRQAADALKLAGEEELTVSGCLVSLMSRDIADYRERGKKPPTAAIGVRNAARKALCELAGTAPSDKVHPLESIEHLRPRLAETEDTAKGLAMLVELCASQPWLVLKEKKARKRLRKDPRRTLLEEISVLLGGDTTPTDVKEIDKILYRRTLKDWLRILLAVLGGVGVGVMTAGFAAPFIGASIGAAMGLSGAAATNAGLAALGGGALSAGGLGMAGGTALVGGIGGTLGGAAGAAASRKVINDDDFPPEAVRIEARKLEAFVARLRAHGQSSQGKAQAVVNDLGEQVEALKSDLAREKAQSSAQEQHIDQLEKKVEILAAALQRMQGPTPALTAG